MHYISCVVSIDAGIDAGIDAIKMTPHVQGSFSKLALQGQRSTSDLSFIHSFQRMVKSFQRYTIKYIWHIQTQLPKYKI